MTKKVRVGKVHRDKEDQTVIGLLLAKEKRLELYPVGGLDRDTEGLALIAV
ncbi:hypothetical protein [uncultured Streptococcus sp.]|uniref:hypothetical protein n=1 Tax=uncultured Streptococcus sp. TaxID=83427 RepID=UPI0037DDC0E0